MSKLRQDYRLGKTFNAIVFHVDYWDYLGWKDAFATASFTARQREIARESGSSEIYTPEFFWNGSESGSSGPALPAVTGPRVGVLEATVSDRGVFDITFSPQISGSGWTAFAAEVEDGITRPIAAGENNGRTLRHDFVALSFGRKEMTRSGAVYRCRLDLAPIGTGRRWVLWVARSGSLRPVQSVSAVLSR
jgi:hypothetical protein